MNDATQKFVVAVRFSKIGKLYHFEAGHIPDLVVGDWVVVETARGWQLGEVAQIIGAINANEETNYKQVDRRATPTDLVRRKSLEAKEEEIIQIARNAGRDLIEEGVKIVAAEYSLDGSRISILYSFEGETKIDLRNVKNEVSRAARPAQVELRQIGPRDVAKMFGGMGACGLPTRCCSKFLTDFSSISIRMAKEQGISLTPAEITGMCGRLRCCLIYEYEMYADNRKQLPKRNKRVLTPVGEGKVVDVLPLKMGVIVDLPDVGRREFNISDLQILEGNAPPPPVKQPDAVVEKKEEGPRSIPTERPRISREPENKISGEPGSSEKRQDRNFQNRKPRNRKRRPNQSGGNEPKQSS
ncbi:MAG: stage 0 sporulation family protein [Chloroflexi bacterium HGW-Chloroflexi-10]|nr:MAG: stage 0 sporulation family protein [Chloroflexi bacterium HGW-Chloroflexi-10]